MSVSAENTRRRKKKGAHTSLYVRKEMLDRRRVFLGFAYTSRLFTITTELTARFL